MLSHILMMVMCLQLLHVLHMHSGSPHNVLHSTSNIMQVVVLFQVALNRILWHGIGAWYWIMEL